MIQEGKARIETGEAFYNPQMKFSRDVSVSALKVLDGDIVLDAFAATGIRGIRYFLEAGKKVAFCDRDPRAVEVIRKNIELNGVEGEVYQEDARRVMERGWDIIDIDPFGSPAPYMDSAARGVKKYLLISATDTAALTGSAPRACLRKYGIKVQRFPTYLEVGARVLVTFVQLVLARHGKAGFPLFVFPYRHHYRLIMKVTRKPSHVSEILAGIKIVSVCPKCGVTDCPHPKVPVGPLWTGPLWDRGFLERAAGVSEGPVRELFLSALQEEQTFLYYDTHALARALKLSPPRIDHLLTNLRGSRTLFSPTGIKTKEGWERVVELMQKQGG